MNDSERAFASLWKEVEEASFSEDVHQHWDISIGDLKVDVKGLKRVTRGGEVEEQFHWLELKNVLGRPGWLYGKADFIAFETHLEWIIVDRKVLVEWAEQKIEQVPASFPLYKIKTRKGRKDVISLIQTADLRQLGVTLRKDVLKQDQDTGEEIRLRPWNLIYLFIRQGKRLSDDLF